MLVARDSRLKPGAYIRNGTTVYEMVGQETDDNGAITGLYVLENIVGEYSASKTYVHRRVVVSGTMIARDYELVKPAPSIGRIPPHLDAQMNEYMGIGN